ncbi:tetratricopeptide repeat protein [bacterium]|nr:tetratricopeptide repeat protein [bacterium]
MYNSIYPININYSKHNQYRNNTNGSDSGVKNPLDGENSSNQNNTFPNGTKVAIDYSKGQINISQVLTDFRSTILAINAPDDVREEVSVYLNLVEKESLKENPSRDIVLGNLKNASKISDSYIASALKKPSDVVEKWIDTLFLQRINLKADPSQINPDFQLEFPQKAQERIDSFSKSQSSQVEPQIEVDNNDSYAHSLEQNEAVEIETFDVVDSRDVSQDVSDTEIKITNQTQQVQEEADNVEVESEFELSANHSSSKANNLHSKTPSQTLFSPLCDADVKARHLFSQAKKMPQTNEGDIKAINLLNEALGVMANEKNANQNIRAAIHIERGKIFDSYDYVDYALRDYYEATKAQDFNLKAQAFYKSGQIYDEFSEFRPAMDNYLSSVAYSAEADNSDAQSRVLAKIANLYTKKYDAKNALQFSDLAIDAANASKNDALIAKTYSNDAQNSQYLGDNDRALDSYKNALSVFARSDESYEEMAYNYEQAAVVMRKLGNHSKAAKLQSKANLYYQKAAQQQTQLEEAS